MKPYLRGDTVLYMNPGHTGGALRAAHILGRGRIAEANTLSYIARKTSEASAHASSSDKPVTVGVFPAKDTEAVLEVIRKAYPMLSRAAMYWSPRSATSTPCSIRRASCSTPDGSSIPAATSASTMTA